MALMEQATVILRGEKLLAELEALRTEAQSLIPIERAIWADNGCARLHSKIANSLQRLRHSDASPAKENDLFDVCASEFQAHRASLEEVNRRNADGKLMQDALAHIERHRVKRETVIGQAQAASLLDAALLVEIYNAWYVRSGPLPNAVPVDIFNIGLPFEVSEIDAALGAARRLIGEAYYVGEALLHKKHQYKRVEEEFRQSNPGFSEESYKEAINYGCFRSR